MAARRRLVVRLIPTLTFCWAIAGARIARPRNLELTRTRRARPAAGLPAWFVESHNDRHWAERPCALIEQRCGL